MFGAPRRRRRPDGWTSTTRASRGATAETTSKKSARTCDEINNQQSYYFIRHHDWEQLAFREYFLCEDTPCKVGGLLFNAPLLVKVGNLQTLFASLFRTLLNCLSIFYECCFITVGEFCIFWITVLHVVKILFYYCCDKFEITVFCSSFDQHEKGLSATLRVRLRAMLRHDTRLLRWICLFQ